jgi:hypothetical protein
MACFLRRISRVGRFRSLAVKSARETRGAAGTSLPPPIIESSVEDVVRPLQLRATDKMSIWLL